MDTAIGEPIIDENAKQVTGYYVNNLDPGYYFYTYFDFLDDFRDIGKLAAKDVKELDTKLADFCSTDYFFICYWE